MHLLSFRGRKAPERPTFGTSADWNMNLYSDRLVEESHVPSKIRLRILTIWPCSCNSCNSSKTSRRSPCKSIIRGRLNVHALEQAPPYTALSYCWGVSDDLALIDLGRDAPFRVSDTVQQALRMLRSSQDAVNIWIDAICINQADNAERGSQVRNMQKIFSFAEDVCIWLGMPPSGGALASCSGRRSVWRNTKVVVNGGDGPIETAEGIQDYSKSQSMTVDVECTVQDGRVVRMSHADALHLLDQGDNVWWKRRWVVQEAAIAQGCPLAMYGSYTFSWRTLMCALYELLRCDTNDASYSRKMSWVRVQEFGRLFDLRQQLIGPRSANISLLSLLECTIDLHTSAPHDTVYALLGLAPPDAQLAIVPDYDVDSLTLFRQVTQYLMTACKGRYPLDIMASRWRMGGKSTWACDFTQPLDQRGFSREWRESSRRQSSTEFELFGRHDWWNKCYLNAYPPRTTADTQKLGFSTEGALFAKGKVLDFVIEDSVVTATGTLREVARKWRLDSYDTSGLKWESDDFADAWTQHSTYSAFLTQSGWVGICLDNFDTHYDDAFADAVVVILEGASTPLLLRIHSDHTGCYSTLLGPVRTGRDQSLLCSCFKGVKHEFEESQWFEIR